MPRQNPAPGHRRLQAFGGVGDALRRRSLRPRSMKGESKLGCRPVAHATPAADTTADPNQAVDACFFELSTDLLCVLGLDGRIVRANAAWQRVLGLDGDELV